jgi:hypothetical protein
LDLSFHRFSGGRAGVAARALPTELAVLLVGIAARQAASPTARAQARLTVVAALALPLSPVSGAFHAGAAALLRHWKER